MNDVCAIVDHFALPRTTECIRTVYTTEIMANRDRRGGYEVNVYRSNRPKFNQQVFRPVLMALVASSSSSSFAKAAAGVGGGAGPIVVRFRRAL